MVGCKFPDASLIPYLTVEGVANTCRAKQEDASKTSLGLEKINTKTEEHCQKSPDVAMSHGYRNWDIIFSWPVHESYTPRWKHHELHCIIFRTYRPSPHQQPWLFVTAKHFIFWLEWALGVMRVIPIYMKSGLGVWHNKYDKKIYSRNWFNFWQQSTNTEHK